MLAPRYLANANCWRSNKVVAGCSRIVNVWVALHIYERVKPDLIFDAGEGRPAACSAASPAAAVTGHEAGENVKCGTSGTWAAGHDQQRNVHAEFTMVVSSFSVAISFRRQGQQQIPTGAHPLITAGQLAEDGL